MPIAYNTESLPTDLPASFRLLVPEPVAHLVRTLEKLSGEGDDFGYDEFGYGTGIGKWRVEYRYTGFGGRVEVYLICAYAETTDDQELSYDTKINGHVRGKQFGNPSDCY